jgi:hypothetical protein
VLDHSRLVAGQRGLGILRSLSSSANDGTRHRGVRVLFMLLSSCYCCRVMQLLAACMFSRSMLVLRC